MSWSIQLRNAITDELKGYELYFSPEDVPPATKYPNEWRGFGHRDGDERTIPERWKDFKNHLPRVCAWLDECIVGTVLAINDEPYLVYVYREASDICMYMGGAPLASSTLNNKRLGKLPNELKEFYTELHNGFGFYIGGTMGPSRFEDFENIDDLCDEDNLSFPGILAVFSNGGGDYLCTDETSPDGPATIWWHEEPESPTKDIELWCVMDAWMSIFLENSESRKSTV